MTITVGTDSYITVAEADAYSVGRGWAAWDTATVDQKEFALKEATVYLDQTYTFKGSIAEATQVLSWPRKEVEDKEGRAISPTVVPQRVKDAQAEIGFRRLSAALVTNSASGTVTEIQTGSVRMKFGEEGQEVNEADAYRDVDRLLAGLYLGRAGQELISVSLTKA